MLKKRPMSAKNLKIGTRGSPLALYQTNMVAARIAMAHPEVTLETVIIKTSGDWKPEQGEKRLSEIEGGKGLFVREIERALTDGDIDMAVHSMKDMPSFLPEGLALDHVLERADIRDAFISHKAKSFLDLPEGAVVGTSSTRRGAMVLSRRPDLKIVTFRGNVATRLEKLAQGQVDATFLAMAGLTRLGVTGDFIHPVDMDDMLPACGQGIIAIETRAADMQVRSLLDDIHHAPTGLRGDAERRALQILDGSCHTPIGAHAHFAHDDDTRMTLRLFVASLDGRDVYQASGNAVVETREQALDLAEDLAGSLKVKIPAGLFE